MRVPWSQIVQLMPSIVELSRELLKRSGRPALTPPESVASPAPELEARIAALEENERRQAELVTSMADQLAQLTGAVTALHAQRRLLIIGQVVSALVAVVALGLVLAHHA